MKRIRVALVVIGALLGMSVPARAIPAVVFSLDPADGQLAGQAGTALGWGYMVTTAAGYVTIQSITFGDASPIGVFGTPGVPLAAASNGSPLIVPWFMDISGLQYDIFGGAALGTFSQGLMTLIY